MEDVRVWDVDTAGVVDAEGRPLPRKRWVVRGTRTHAIRERARRIAALLGTSPSPRPPTAEGDTVRGYAERYYLPWLEERRRPTTANGKAVLLRTHILPEWGDLTLQQVQTPEVQREIRAYLEAPPQEQRGNGLRKASSRNAVLITLGALLSHAADPARAPGGIPRIQQRHKIELLKESRPQRGKDGIIRGSNREHRMTDDDSRLLLEAAEAHPDPIVYAVVVLGIYCGMRISEIAGLRWSNVDLEEGRIWVCEQICPKSKLTVDTKNGKHGWAYLDSIVLEFLKAHKERGIHAEYVTGHRQGPHTGQQLAKMFRRLADNTKGLSRRYTPHDMRHTFASRLADAGAEPHEIAEAIRDSIEEAFTYLHADSSAVGSKVLASVSTLRGGSPQPTQPDPSKEDHRDQLITQLMAQNAELTDQIKTLNKMIARLMGDEPAKPHLHVVESK